MADRILTGDRELERLFTHLPQSAAQRLQAAAVANHLDHRREVVRSSSFSAAGKNRVSRAIEVAPKERVLVRRLQDVTAETFSAWRGPGVDDPDEGAAARVEKRVGDPVLRPSRARFLLIPQGPMLTPTGRPKRRGGRQIDLAKEKDAVLVRTKSGRRLLIRRRKARKRGRQRQSTTGTRGERIRRPLAALEGERDEVIGIAVREARAVLGLDFFGAWDRLEARRNDRYDRLLDELVR